MAAANKAKPALKNVKKCVKKMAAQKENAAKLVKKLAKRPEILTAKKAPAVTAPKKVRKHIV